ncbi:MAG: DNA translocase FtsK 4TM domain-containing protein, partial [Coriobacteriales bacterium]|nr:DNA translocase FtsK 4TM domain-containing protein [Coriobacteriales bacterium]
MAANKAKKTKKTTAKNNSGTAARNARKATGKSASKQVVKVSNQTAAIAGKHAAKAARAAGGRGGAGGNAGGARLSQQAPGQQFQQPMGVQPGPAPMFGSRTINDIIGVIIAIIAIVIFIAVIMPGNAPLSKVTSGFFKMGFGVGAYVLPVLLIVWAATFFIRQRIPSSSWRLGIGLVVILLAILGLVAISTPRSNIDPSMIINTAEVASHGGYVGGALAWMFDSLVGTVATAVICVGLIIVGLIIIGFSITGLVDRIIGAIRGRNGANGLDAQQQAMQAQAAQNMQAMGAYGLPMPQSGPYGAGVQGMPGAQGAYGAAAGAAGAPGMMGFVPPAQTTAVLSPNGLSARLGGGNSNDKTQNMYEGAFSEGAQGKLPLDKSANGQANANAETLKFGGDYGLDDAAEGAGTAGAAAIGAAAGAAGAAAAGAGGKRGKKNRNGKSAGAGGPSSGANGSGSASDGQAIDSDHAGAGAGDGQEPDFVLPSMSLLRVSKEKAKTRAGTRALRTTAERLQETLEEFGVEGNVVGWQSGPTVTLYKISLGEGVRLNRVTALQDDIQLALAALAVRIVAPIPGTSLVGIEVPNETRNNVLLGDVLPYAEPGVLELAIGKDVEGDAICADLAKMPHLLIGGTTGSGKSVAINSMIMSILMRCTPADVRMILIDPKRVELSLYNGIPHLYVPVVTDAQQAA